MASVIEQTENTTLETASLLSFDEQEMLSKFSQVPFLIAHRLSDHPLFSVGSILELSKRLPEQCIEYNAGELPISSEQIETPMTGLSIDETIRRIEECKSWMVLKYVEQDPAFRDVLETCLEELKPYTEQIAPGMSCPQAFVFLTSPGSVTPYHIDPEHNFLLQIHGWKEIHQYDGRLKSILSEEDLEHFYADKGRNLQYDEAYEQNSWTFRLNAGLGLHFPVTYPHYVQNGDEVSISFSITFRTPDLDRRQALYKYNSKRRDQGGTPPAVGSKPMRDEMLYQYYRVMRKLGRQTW